MQFISGRVLIVGNNEVIHKDNYHFSTVILIIKKKMNGKMRNIAFECIGKLADEVLKLNKGEKIEVKYLITSTFRNNKWFTNLHAKDIFKIEDKPKNKNENQTELNILFYGNTLKEGTEGQENDTKGFIG
jgi:hypothetical protein